MGTTLSKVTALKLVTIVKPIKVKAGVVCLQVKLCDPHLSALEVFTFTFTYNAGRCDSCTPLQSSSCGCRTAGLTHGHIKRLRCDVTGRVLTEWLTTDQS